MAKELKCGDLMQGCQQVIRGDSEEKVLQQAAEHAKKAHNIGTISPDMVQKVKSAIRTV